MLSVRIVTTDYYLAPPIRGFDTCYSGFRGAEVKKVPVFRIYGATPAGQKTCLHVHGILPYLYVLYDGTLPLDRYLRQVASSIDKALNIALGKSSSSTQHIYKVALVSAIPFYGYHESEQQFLKIYLYNPRMVKRVADLLLGGAVLNKVLQPFESHIPYNLQTFIDYNLYGMNMINVAAAKFRRPSEEGGSEEGMCQNGRVGWKSPGNLTSPTDSILDTYWNTDTIPSECWMPLNVERQSSCELEADVVATDILNRLDVGTNIGSNPGLAALWEDERQRRREKGDDSQISPQGSPEREDIDWTEAEAHLQNRLQEILLDLEPYIRDSEPEDGGRKSTPEESSYPSTPASFVDSHHSFAEDLLESQSSEDTVILDTTGQEVEEEPVISEVSILRVVSSSQSFLAHRPEAKETASVLVDTQDRSLAQLLAAMGEDDSSPVASQVASQAATLEEADSVLSQVPGSAPGEKVEEEEEDDVDIEDTSKNVDEEDGEQNLASSSQPLYDLQGMDLSWNSSQWVDVEPILTQGADGNHGDSNHDSSEDEDDILPQYDGPADDKSEDQNRTKKRLGILGPSLQRFKVKTMSSGAFSIMAKTSQGTVATFTGSTKLQPIRPGFVKPGGLKPVRVNAGSPTATPVDASRTLVFDLRSPIPQQVHSSDDSSSDDQDGGHKTGSRQKLYNHKRQPGHKANSKSAASGKNSPKEASQASDAFDDLSPTERGHSPPYRSKAKCESVGRSGSCSSYASKGPRCIAANKNTPSRPSASRHDNIFASLASELSTPNIGLTKATSKNADTRPSETRPMAQKHSSQAGKLLESPTSPVISDASLDEFMKRSRANLSNRPSAGQATMSKPKPRGGKSKSLSRRDQMKAEAKRSGRLTPEESEVSSDSDKEGSGAQNLLVPRRRSTDSSSNSDLHMGDRWKTYEHHVSRAARPSMSPGSVSRRKPSSDQPAQKSSEFFSPVAAFPQEETHQDKGSEETSEVSDDQMSLRPDPDSDPEVNMWDQMGCDDLPDIVDLPADPTSVSDKEDLPDEGPVTYEEHNTVIVSRPAKSKTGRGQRSRGSPRGRGRGRPPQSRGRGRGVWRSERSSSEYYSGIQGESDPLYSWKSGYANKGTTETYQDQTRYTPTDSSSTSYNHKKPLYSSLLSNSPAPAGRKLTEYPNKNCVSLADRKRKLSLKKEQKRRENKEMLSRQNSMNISDADSYLSSDISYHTHSDSPTSQGSLTEQIATECPTGPFHSVHGAPTSPLTSLPYRTTPAATSQELYSGTCGTSSPTRHSLSETIAPPQLQRRAVAIRGRCKKGGSLHVPPPGGKPFKRWPRGSRGGYRGRRPSDHGSFQEAETVSLSASNIVNYYNGMRVCLQGRKTRHMADETSACVRVRKSDCQKFSLTDVGQEKLALHNMNPYELIHSDEYNPSCDKKYRVYKVELSAIKRSPGRPPGWKRQKSTSSSVNEMLISPGNSETRGVIDISLLTAEASMLKRCESKIASLEHEDEDESQSGSPSCDSVGSHSPQMETTQLHPKTDSSKVEAQAHPAQGGSPLKPSTSSVKTKGDVPGRVAGLGGSSGQRVEMSRTTSAAHTAPRQVGQENANQTSQPPQQQQDKGDMSEVDFSVLENTMDPDVDVLQATESDPHHQLHTPPLVMDPDLEESSPRTNSSPHTSDMSTPRAADLDGSEKNDEEFSQHSRGKLQSSDVSLPTEKAMSGKSHVFEKQPSLGSTGDYSSDDDRTIIGDGPDDELTETDLYSDSNAGLTSPANSDLPDKPLELTTMKSLTKQDSLSTEDSASNDGHPAREKGISKRPKKGSLKMKIKRFIPKSSEIDQELYSMDSSGKRKRRKIEQSDHYRFRSKRVAVDYSHDAYAHIFKLEKSKRLTLPDPGEQKKQQRFMRRKDPEIQYIIINRFRGYRSMRVMVEKLKVNKKTVKLNELRRQKQQSSKRKDSFSTRRTIVSDVPHENQSDPLWEAQMERLGADGDDDEDEDTHLSDLSSEDESSQDSSYMPSLEGRLRRRQSDGKVAKKKVMSYHKRLSNAFCVKTRRPKRRPDQTKIWSTLSLLHNATVAQTTNPNTVYSDQVEEDHKSEFVDVMYKLALISPPQSEQGEESPPQPLSPAVQMEDHDLLFQQQDAGPRRPPYHSLPRSDSTLSSRSLLWAQSTETGCEPTENTASIKSPAHVSRTSRASSPTVGLDSDGTYSRQPTLMSEYNSSVMNKTGSPYAVKEAVVRLLPGKSSALFGHHVAVNSNPSSNTGSPRYSKDVSPPDLGPPAPHHMSPHSMSSGSNASPPHLVLHDKEASGPTILRYSKEPAINQSTSGQTPLSAMEAYASFFPTFAPPSSSVSDCHIMDLSARSLKERRDFSPGSDRKSGTGTEDVSDTLEGSIWRQRGREKTRSKSVGESKSKQDSFHHGKSKRKSPLKTSRSDSAPAAGDGEMLKKEIYETSAITRTTTDRPRKRSLSLKKIKPAETTTVRCAESDKGLSASKTTKGKSSTQSQESTKASDSKTNGNKQSSSASGTTSGQPAEKKQPTSQEGPGKNTRRDSCERQRHLIQAAKEKVLSKFGVDVSALKERAKAESVNKTSEVSRSGEEQTKLEENKASGPSPEKGKQSEDHNGGDTTEEEDHDLPPCIRSQSPPQSPAPNQPDEASEDNGEDPDKGKGDANKKGNITGEGEHEEESEDEEESTEEESDAEEHLSCRGTPRKDMSPIRSPSPVAFSERCREALTMSARANHGSDPLPVPSTQEPRVSPSRSRSLSITASEESDRCSVKRSPPKSPDSCLSPSMARATKVRKIVLDQVDEAEGAAPLSNQHKDTAEPMETEGIDLAKPTARRTRQAPGNARDSDDSTIIDSDDTGAEVISAKCMRTFSPIRSPSPGLVSPKSPALKLVSDTNNLQEPLSTKPTEANDSLDHSKSDLFSPDVPSLKTDQKRRTDEEGSSSSSEGSDSEDEHVKVCERLDNPIRSPSPPALRQTGTRYHDSPLQTQTCETPPNAPKNNSKSPRHSISDVETSESEEDIRDAGESDQEQADSFQRTFSPIRSPSPPVTSTPRPTTQVTEPGSTPAPGDKIREKFTTKMSESGESVLFSPKPDSSAAAVTTAEDSKLGSVKDDSDHDGYDSEVESVQKCERLSSPIRSPSPVNISSPPPVNVSSPPPAKTDRSKQISKPISREDEEKQTADDSHCSDADLFSSGASLEKMQSSGKGNLGDTRELGGESEGSEEDSDEEDDKSWKKEPQHFSPIRSPSPVAIVSPCQSPSHEATRASPADIPVSVSVSPSFKEKPFGENKETSVREVRKSQPKSADRAETQFLKPQPSPQPPRSDREEGEIRTDDECLESEEDSDKARVRLVTSRACLSPRRQLLMRHQESREKRRDLEKEEGELTETSTVRTTPGQSPLTITSIDDANTETESQEYEKTGETRETAPPQQMTKQRVSGMSSFKKTIEDTSRLGPQLESLVTEKEEDGKRDAEGSSDEEEARRDCVRHDTPIRSPSPPNMPAVLKMMEAIAEERDEPLDLKETSAVLPDPGRAGTDKRETAKENGSDEEVESDEDEWKESPKSIQSPSPVQSPDQVVAQHVMSADPIRSPSPVHSPDPDLDKHTSADPIQSPSPIQSPEQCMTTSSRRQPAMIPLNIDSGATQDGDPRVRRPPAHLMHPVPSPSPQKSRRRRPGAQTGDEPMDYSDISEDETEMANMTMGRHETWDFKRKASLSEDSEVGPAKSREDFVKSRQKAAIAAAHKVESQLSTSQSCPSPQAPMSLPPPPPPPPPPPIQCSVVAPQRDSPVPLTHTPHLQPSPVVAGPVRCHGNSDTRQGSPHQRHPYAGAPYPPRAHSHQPPDQPTTQGQSYLYDPSGVSHRPHGPPAYLHQRHVFQPAEGPPDRREVVRDTRDYDQSEGHQQGVYYSDPADAPHRPREVGGRVLKIKSNTVCDLAEIEGPLAADGLYTWQAVLMANQTASQETSDVTSSFSLQREAERNTRLRAALMGDRRLVITPNVPPPGRTLVERWLRARELYKQLKHPDKNNKAEWDMDLASKRPESDTPKSREELAERMTTPVRKPTIAMGKGKAGRFGRVKNPQFTSIKNKREQCTAEEVQPDDGLPKEEGSEAGGRALGRSLLGLSLDDSAIDLETSWEFKTPKRRCRRSSSADSKLGSTQIDTQPTALLPKESTSQFTARGQGLTDLAKPRRKRRGSADELNPCLHSTPTLVSSTPASQRVSFLQSDTPSCTPIKRSASQDSPSAAGSSGGQSGATPIGRTVERRAPSPITPTTSRGSNKRRFLRRTSTGTQALVQRMLQNSQLRKQLSTPGSVVSQGSQIEGPTPKNTYGFRVSMQNIRDAKALHEFQYLTVFSLELHVTTRIDLRPDAEFDHISAIFFSILNDVPPEKGQRQVTGVIAVDPESANQSSQDKDTPKSRSAPLFERSGVMDLHVTHVRDEEELLQEFLKLIARWDPDILVGWEIQSLSWGFLLRRAAHLNMNIVEKLSRVPGGAQESRFDAEKDEYGADTMSEINIAGRVVINLWRVLRHEVTLNIYTFENVVYHVLHRRVPKFPFRTLTTWWQHRTDLYRWRTVEYYQTRVKGNLEVMEQVDLIGQTSEFARVFGIEFYHVLSRGSQYRVESMMLRIAKPMNFAAVSPSVQQRARQSAPECIPLTLEPESRFYNCPVVVLDFQSLYPSIMIAYNYCYSTCLGRLGSLERAQDGAFDFGCTSLNIPPALLKKLQNDVNICPNGVVFVKEHIRKGIISRMVEDILRTRLMVKKSMKEYKDDRTLHRLLHARQLGLKLIANVTFGYTAASFSGRMPCVEIGDSIVRKARETLERAIQLVQDTPRWGGRVVYGDTDSMFIAFPGRTKDEAFDLGQEIADAVTQDNPKPIKLKFEKVYLPCVLQTKKRYVGFMYETKDQQEPVFEAKGIETVRRDGCGATSKILERSLKILFTSRDLSAVKQYVQRQFIKMLEGHADLQDFIIAKEYRGMAGYKPAATVPALEIAKSRLSKDRCSEPRVGERVPYVIVYGTPGVPLIQLVREPQALLTDPALRLNATYYITKAILPPLHRALGLLGADVFSWYTDLPRVVRLVPQSHFTSDAKKGMISQYFTTLNCPVCEETTNQGMCPSCHKNPQRVATILGTRIQQFERTHDRLSQVCQSCMGTRDNDLPCASLDCPILFRLVRAGRDLSLTPQLRQLLETRIAF